MVDVVNIPQIVWQIFKISPQLLSKYHTYQDQLINLIFIPHVILFLFIMAFAIGIIGRIIGKSHKGFEILIGIASYVYIIWNGWYGLWIVPLINAWFGVALIMALVVFGISMFWHPAAHEAGLKLLGAGAKTIADKTIGKSKKIEQLQKDLRSVQESIGKTKAERDAAQDMYTKSTIQHQLEQYKEMERQIKRAIEELE